MSDEQISGIPPVVVVEQDCKRQETFYTEIKDDTNAHKGTTVPAVPSIVSEKQKEAIKNLPPDVKRTDDTPESIELKPLQTDKMRGVIIPPAHPIPLDVHSINSTESDVKQEKYAAKNDGDSNITVETTKEQVIDEDKEQSEWSDDEDAGGLPRSDSRASRASSSRDVKKKEIFWTEKKNGQNVIFQDVDLRSQSLMLDRKASIGPCYRPAVSFGPSGISINIPKKSTRCVNQPSGINITVSKKCLSAKSETKNCHEEQTTNGPHLITLAQNNHETNRHGQMSQFFSIVKNKVNNFQKKMKNTLHM